MENKKKGTINPTDELEEYIESSQVPTLRSKIRQTRPNYRELSFGRDSKKPPKRTLRDNRTVSQCIRQVWKNPRNKPSSTASNQQQQQAASVANDKLLEKEYIKFASQQQEAPNVGGIQPVPSVSLFAQQEDAVARYLLNETTEAQVEEQLQKLLDGFQAEYEKECATMESSPVHALLEEEHEVAASSLQSTLLPGANEQEIARTQQNEQPAAVSSPLQPFISEQFLMPNFSEEIARLAEMVQKDGSPLRTDGSVMTDPMVTPIIPIVELREETPPAMDKIPNVTNNVCLDWSAQNEQSVCVVTNAAQSAQPADDDEWLNVSQKRSSQMPSSKRTEDFLRPDDVLDLRVKYHRPAPKPVTGPSFALPILPQRPCVRSTSDVGTQTRFPRRYRNVGIQHRPVASLDFTDRNMIVLAQQFEADPIMLERRLRRVAQTACEPIWRARDLSTVFTAADPYFANLKHFL